MMLKNFNVYRIRRLQETGISIKFSQLTFSNKKLLKINTNLSLNQKNDFDTLSINELRSIFLLLFAGFLFSTFFMLLELFIYFVLQNLIKIYKIFKNFL